MTVILDRAEPSAPPPAPSATSEPTRATPLPLAATAEERAAAAALGPCPFQPAAAPWAHGARRSEIGMELIAATSAQMPSVQAALERITAPLRQFDRSARDAGLQPVEPGSTRLTYARCEVARNDGRLLSLDCSSNDTAPRPNIVGFGIHFAVSPNGLTYVGGGSYGGYECFHDCKSDLRAMLPDYTGGVEELRKVCRGERSSYQWYDTHRLPGVVIPLADHLLLRPHGDHRHGGACRLPYAAIAPWTQCGPLGLLARPAVAPVVASTQRQPVAETYHERDDGTVSERYPVLSTEGPDRAAVADLSQQVERWARAHRERPRSMNGTARTRCDVLLNTRDMLGIVCTHWRKGQPVQRHAFNRRRRDDTMETIELSALLDPTQLAQHCWMEADGDPSDTPPLPENPFQAPTLRLDGVQTWVTWREDRFYPSRCVVPFARLGTSLAKLARDQP